MSHDDTKIRIEAALERIIGGNPQRIQNTQKLSVSSVQKEAGLGQGSIYYYPELVEKIKRLVLEGKAKDSVDITPKNDVARLRQERNKEVQIKENYRDQVKELREQLAKAAADHHRLAYLVYERDKQIENLKIRLQDANRSQIRPIND